MVPTRPRAVARAQVAGAGTQLGRADASSAGAERSSALVYLYAGLEAGATVDDVLARAEADGAPFAGSEELKAWVRQGLDELRSD